MPRAKEYYREVLADIFEVTGKRVLGVYDVRKYLKIGYEKAVDYLDGEKKITIHKFAAKLLK